ncbi:MAG: sulfite exporter TauE/SafE family protein [Spirochaetota bacterium]
MALALTPGFADSGAASADLGATASEAVATGLIQTQLPWWGWALLLFGFTAALGVVAVIGGVGGGVLFVPIVSAVFPFHFDFVRGAGLMVALCGALSAAPILLKKGLADMRLGWPVALFGAIGGIVGANLGLALPTGIVEALLGVAIVSIVVLMLSSRRTDFPGVRRSDPVSAFLGIGSTYFDESLGRAIDWKVHRTPVALASYLAIGMIGGMFGLGAGWANVPALNLLMGAPLRVAVGTSGFIMTVNSASAVWIYINRGALLPLIAVPSIAGMMIGTRVGAILLPRIRARAIRWIVIGLMGITGLRSLAAGILEMVR